MVQQAGINDGRIALSIENKHHLGYAGTSRRYDLGTKRENTVCGTRSVRVHIFRYLLRHIPNAIFDQLVDVAWIPQTILPI